MLHYKENTFLRRMLPKTKENSISVFLYTDSKMGGIPAMQSPVYSALKILRRRYSKFPTCCCLFGGRAFLLGNFTWTLARASGVLHSEVGQ